jgi:uncharacterized damage-inducible protein DinB
LCGLFSTGEDATMNGVELVRRLHQHRAWVNGKLIQAAFALKSADLQTPLPIGQGSIWKSLVHMYAAEYVWLESLLGDESPVAPGDLPDKIPGNQEGSGAIRSLDELVGLWRELDARWQAYLDGLNDADLDPLVYKVSSLQGTRSATRRGDILLHVCTHAHYTTAQVVNMLRQLGAPALPDPMLITMARQETVAAKG